MFLVVLLLLAEAAASNISPSQRCVSADAMRTASGKLFSMSREKADAVRRTRLSGQPCSAIVGFHGGTGEYMATFRKHACTSYTVSAPKGHTLTTCFVPDVVWFSLGREHVLEDHTLCTCRNQAFCSQTLTKLDAATTYVLLVIAGPPARRRLGAAGLPVMPTLLPPPVSDWHAHIHVTGSCKAEEASTKKHAIVIAGGACTAALLVAFVASRKGGGQKGYTKISTRGSSQRSALSSSSGL